MRIELPVQGGVSEPSRVLKVGVRRSDSPQRAETTRYLCATAYLSRPFRDWVIEHFTGNQHVALAESIGVDPANVLKHSLIARNIGRMRDILLCIPALILLPAAIYIFIFTSRAVESAGVLAIALVIAFVATLGIIGS